MWHWRGLAAGKIHTRTGVAARLCWSSHEVIHHVQGQEQWLHLAGWAMRRYTSCPGAKGEHRRDGRRENSHLESNPIPTRDSGSCSNGQCHAQ